MRKRRGKLQEVQVFENGTKITHTCNLLYAFLLSKTRKWENAVSNGLIAAIFLANELMREEKTCCGVSGQSFVAFKIREIFRNIPYAEGGNEGEGV